MNINAKILKQILLNWIQQHIKESIHHDQWDISLEGMSGSVYETVHVILHIKKWRGRIHMVILIDVQMSFLSS